MTRFNLISPNELSDQHLIAEYHEILRIIRQDINTTNAPEKYCLGKGHVKWAKKHSKFLAKRFTLVFNEMTYRGFKTTYSAKEMNEYIFKTMKADNDFDYIPTQEDINASRNRIIEKIELKPSWYRWTKRPNPFINILK